MNAPRATILILLAASACSEREPRSTSQSRAPREAAPVVSGVCRLDPIQAWIPDASAGSLALAIRGSAALVTLTHGGRTRARAIALDGRARGAPRDFAAEEHASALALEPFGERFLFVAGAACRGGHCLFSRTLGASGDPIGSVLELQAPDRVRTSKRASGDGHVYFAWSTRDGARALEHFSLRDGGLAHVRIELGSEPPSVEAPVTILGLASEGARWAAIWRLGLTEDAASQVLVAGDASPPHAVEALHDASVIDSMRLADGTLSLVATFEFSRPHLFVLPIDAREPSSVTEVGAQGPLPPELADRYRAELDIDERGLWLHVRNAAGYPIGPRARMTESIVRSAAIARAGDDFLIAWIERGAVHGRRAHCPILEGQPPQLGSRPPAPLRFAR